jgi:hypothetical protein
MDNITKGTNVSIRLRTGEVVFGKYEKEGKNGYHTVRTADGQTYDRKLDKIKVLSDDDVDFHQNMHPVANNNTAKPAPHYMTPPSQFSINDKFKFLENMVGMVVKKTAVSMVITGEGGLGKTYTVKTEILKRNLVEDHDYMIIKGFSTAKGLYRTLYENSDKLIVFDDCDEVLKNDVAKNLLKGALDSYDERIISWITNSFSDDLPSSFEFEGQIIFISNLPQHKVDQAILSRSMSIDLSMDTTTKIERMREILPKIKPSIPIEIKEECLNLIEEHKDQCGDLNMRTLIKIIGIRTDAENEEIWRDMSIYAMTSTVN